MMVERVGKVKSNPDEALRWPGHTSISASRKINDIEGRASPRGGAAHGGWRRFLARGSLDAMEKGGVLHERAQDSRASVICFDHYPSLKAQSERIHVHTGNILAVVSPGLAGRPRI